MTYPFELKIIDDNYGIYNCPAEWYVNETGASFHRVYYAYEGSAVYEDSLQCFELKRGSIYIFPTNKPYRIDHDPDHPFKCLWFHITISPVILNPVIGFIVQRNTTVYYLIKAIESAINNTVNLKKDYMSIEQMLHTILYIISIKENFLLLNDTYLLKVTQYIQDHYMDNISNECLSKISGYNTSYLIRLFKKTFGVPPQKYIQNYRLSKAILLIRKNVPISEVCIKTGYTDVKAFCKMFKKVKGVPPSKYKKSHYWQP